jgi:cytochrome bd-type quinol oxidase subunit 2
MWPNLSLAADWALAMLVPMAGCVAAAFGYLLGDEGDDVQSRPIVYWHPLGFVAGALLALAWFAWRGGPGTARSFLVLVTVNALFVATAALIIYALVAYRGPKRVHLWQLLSIPCALSLWFMSMVLVTGDGP